MRTNGWYWIRMNDKFKWSVALFHNGVWKVNGVVTPESHFLEIGYEFKKLDANIRPMKASAASYA